MDFSQQIQLEHDIRGLFYLLVYTKTQWQIIVYDNNLKNIIKTFDTEINSNLEINNFLVGHQKQIIIEADNDIKFFNVKTMHRPCFVAGQIKHIDYSFRQYFVLIKIDERLNLLRYDNEWNLKERTTISGIKSGYKSAKFFFDIDYYILLDYEEKKILYRFDSKMELLDMNSTFSNGPVKELFFDQRWLCDINQGSFYLYDQETQKIHVYSMFSLTLKDTFPLNEKGVNLFHTAGMIIYFIKNKQEITEVNSYFL